MSVAASASSPTPASPAKIRRIKDDGDEADNHSLHSVAISLNPDVEYYDELMDNTKNSHDSGGGIDGGNDQFGAGYTPRRKPKYFEFTNNSAVFIVNFSHFI